MYKRFGIYTIVAIYFLILVGGIVRSTGAGMGCPDWPRCFDEWVPPTDESQLPANYAEKLTEQRKKKNERFEKLMTSLGFESVIHSSSHNIYENIYFNVTKAWIEYVNRVIGVIIGLFIFITFLLSFSYLKESKRIFFLSLLAFVLVVVQAFLGAVVVSSNLLPGLISVHMLLALIIVGILIYTVYLANAVQKPLVPIVVKRKLNLLILISMVCMLAQLLLGVDVREGIDVIAKEMNYVGRHTWIEKLDVSFLIHRSFSLFILATHLLLAYWVKKNREHFSSSFSYYAIVVMIVLEILSGAGMAYFAIPKFLQPLHLLLANLIIGLQFYVLLELNVRIKNYRVTLS
ncbi:MAG: heme A synthase [Cytophagales bacterium]|nr:heme A synthase [Cytophagales bacterium]